jgi:superfamily II DNA or RNA helicase
MHAASLQPRPCQTRALRCSETAFDRGVKRILVTIATGGGKTIVFAYLMTLVFAYLIVKRPGRAIDLAHRDELIDQAKDKLSCVTPGIRIG